MTGSVSTSDKRGKIPLLPNPRGIRPDISLPQMFLTHSAFPQKNCVNTHTPKVGVLFSLLFFFFCLFVFLFFCFFIAEKWWNNFFEDLEGLRSLCELIYMVRIPNNGKKSVWP